MIKKLCGLSVSLTLLTVWGFLIFSVATKSEATKSETNNVPDRQYERVKDANYKSKTPVTFRAGDVFPHAPKYQLKSKITDLDIAILTVNAHYEANNQGIDGMRLVNAVVFNRIATNMCDSVYSCVTQKNQFSWMQYNKNVAAMVLQSKHNLFAKNIIAESNKPIYSNAKKSVQLTICGANCYNDVSFNRVTYYYNPEFSSPNGKKFFNTVTKTMVIGDHIGGIK